MGLAYIIACTIKIYKNFIFKSVLLDTKSDTIYSDVSFLLYLSTASDISFLIQPDKDRPSEFAILSAWSFKSLGITMEIRILFSEIFPCGIIVTSFSFK